MVDSCAATVITRPMALLANDRAPYPLVCAGLYDTWGQCCITQYPVWNFAKLFILYFQANLFIRTLLKRTIQPSHCIGNAVRTLVHKYPPLSIAKYSFVQLSELEQRKVKEHKHSVRQRTIETLFPSTARPRPSVGRTHCTRIVVTVAIGNRCKHQLGCS